jgi:hypothetical protein
MSIFLYMIGMPAADVHASGLTLRSATLKYVHAYTSDPTTCLLTLSSDDWHNVAFRVFQLVDEGEEGS